MTNKTQLAIPRGNLISKIVTSVTLDLKGISLKVPNVQTKPAAITTVQQETHQGVSMKV